MRWGWRDCGLLFQFDDGVAVRGFFDWCGLDGSLVEFTPDAHGTELRTLRVVIELWRRQIACALNGRMEGFSFVFRQRGIVHGEWSR